VLAALAAGARLRLMAMLDAWQVLGQRLPTRARTLLALRGLRLGLLLDLGFDGGEVGVPGFLKQLTLLGREGFALVAETDPPVMCKFEGQGLNLEVRRLDRGRIPASLLKQALEQFALRRIRVETGQFGSDIHRPNFSMSAWRKAFPTGGFGNLDERRAPAFARR
jgi:hypothetical protein